MKLVVDASNNQESLNVAAVGRVADAIVHKCTQGIGFVDPFYTERRAAAAHARIPFGAYHFAGWEDRDGVAHFGSPAEEAAIFLEHVGTLDASTLQPTLDLEIGNPAELAGWAVEWNRRVERELGIWPMLYSYGDFLSRLELGGRRLRRPIGGGLWLASYSRNDGADHPYMIPAPWQHARLHQFTSVGKVGGVPVRLDLSHAVTLPFAHPVRARLAGYRP